MERPLPLRHVSRLRCAKCFSPVLAKLKAGGGKDVVPLAIFDRSLIPASWSPQHHMHYGSRVLDVDDGLPKFVGRFGGERCGATGEPLDSAPAAAS